MVSVKLPEHLNVATSLKSALSILLRLVRTCGFPRSLLRYLEACARIRMKHEHFVLRSSLKTVLAGA
jgi:hypothetical protein